MSACAAADAWGSALHLLATMSAEVAHVANGQGLWPFAIPGIEQECLNIMSLELDFPQIETSPTGSPVLELTCCPLSKAEMFLEWGLGAWEV